MMTERKYALTKLEPGDYLLPSNDAKTIWRIAQYTDGPSSGLTDWPRDVRVWGVWRWNEPLPPRTVDDVDDWSRWEFCAGPFGKRKEAISEALR